MRILFLDIDGVLNSSSYFLRVDNRADGLRMPPFEEEQIDELAVARLNTILEKTDARIVVSSSWRLAYRPGQLRAILEKRGVLGRRVIDVTPVLKTDLRCQEIAGWLKENKTRCEVEQFVIVDDDHTAGVGFGPQFVWTSFVDGLTDEKAKSCVDILLRPLNEDENL